MFSSMIQGIFGATTLPPGPHRLCRWRLASLRVSLQSRCRPPTKDSEGEAEPKRSPSYPDADGTVAYGDEDDYIKVPPQFTTSLGLFLVRLRLIKTLGRTLSQSELLALCRLAKARSSHEGPFSFPRHSQTPREPTEQNVRAPEEAPQSHEELQKQSQEHDGGRAPILVDPLDVCALLMSGEIEVADLPLLQELDEVAEETEMLQQREDRWCSWAWLLHLRRKRGQIWEAAAGKLQHGPSTRGGPSFSRMTRLIELQRDYPPPDSLLTGNMTVAAGDTLGLASGRALRSHFGGPLPGGMSPRGLSLGPPLLSAGEKAETVGGPSTGPSPGGNFRGPLGPWCHPVEETAGDSEAAVKAAAATISRMGSEALALLPHCCKWPLTGPARTRGSASNSMGTPFPWTLQGPPFQEGPVMGINEASNSSVSPEGWKEAVGFRLRRSRMGNRGREIARRRQRLSPLDPPYDAHALLLHPLCPVPCVELPDIEEARASEVHEISLDFLGRCKATISCPHCCLTATRKSIDGVGGVLPPPLCPIHQRLHYKKVGEGPERVILIHGICMSGYFFADVIRALLPPSGGGAGPGEIPGNDDDPHERWRYSFYCVDLLGYGKSSSVPTTQNYSRREQAEAILRDVILANGFTSVHLVGHSFGGLVAAELCEMLPTGFVTTLILLSPAYFESERQAMRILSHLHFPASHTVAHPYFGEFLLRLGVVLRPLFEPIILSIVPKEELPQLSVADVFSIRPDALTGTIRSIVQDRVDRTFQLLRQRGQRASLFHGTHDGVIPIRQARFLALRYPNIHVRALEGFVHHFPASHSQFTADIIIQEIGRSLRNGRGLSFSLDGDPANSLIASHALLLPGHPTWD